MWMTLSQVEGVLTSVGLSVATIYGLLQWFGKSWMDQQFKKRLEQLKHDQQKEIEQLRHQINALFSRVSKIHEKEFEVLPRAWTLLHQAYGSVFRVAMPFKFFPFWIELNDAKTAQIALNNYLAVNSIFMTDEALSSSSPTLSSVGDLFGEIESAVQKRLRYEEA
jgi:hypothetical protein